MLFLCIKDQCLEWTPDHLKRGFMEGNSYEGHYVGVDRYMINLPCPERGGIVSYGRDILDIMVEDPENEEKH